MPQIGVGSGKSSRGEQRARRKPPPPPRPPPPRPYRPPSRRAAVRAQRQSYGSLGRAVDRVANQQRRSARAARPRRGTVAFGPIGAQAEPFGRQQAQARRAVNRARAALPPHPAIPRIPVLPSYTQRQINAITQAYAVGRRKAGVRSVMDLYGLGNLQQRQNMEQVAAAVRRSPYMRQLGALNARDRVSALRPVSGSLALGPASIDVSPFLRAGIGAERFIGAHTSLGTGDIGPRQAFSNALSDVKALGEAPFVGGYEVAQGAYEAASGKGTKRLQQLASGVAQGVSQEVQHPLKYAGQHPIFAALDLAGAGAIAGRLGGAVARGVGSNVEAGGLRGALARGGSTVRPPIALTDDPAAALVQRTYSKDVTRKAAQVAADARRQPLRDQHGNVVTTVDRGRRVPVLKGSPAERERLARRRGDFVASRANSAERIARQRAEHEMRVRGIRGKRSRDLVAMVVEGTITSARHFERDLRAHAERLRAVIEQHGTDGSVFRHRGELQAAKARLATVEKALADKRVLRQAPKIVAAGEKIGAALNTHEAEAIKLGLLHPTRAARAKLVPAAVEHMGARFFTPKELQGVEGATARELKHGSIRKPDGTYLSNASVEEFLRSRGREPGTVAYLPHRLDIRGRRAYHTQFRPGQRPTLDKAESRTGSAYAKGATEASARLVTEQAVRQATQLAKAGQIDQLVREHAIVRPNGAPFTEKAAVEAAQRIEHDTGERLTPVRMFGARLPKQARALVRDEQHPQAMEGLHQRLLNDRIVTEPDVKSRAQNVGLMPTALIERLQDHLRPAGDIERFFQFLNRPFRMAVLPQPRWLTGNFVEPFIVRLPGAGAGVNVFGLGVDVLASRRVLRALERGTPEERRAADVIRAHQEGGLFVGGGAARSVRRTTEEALPQGVQRAYGRAVAKLPAIGQMAGLSRSIGHLLVKPLDAFFKANRVIEGGAQRQALGKSIREDIQNFTGSWLQTVRLGQRAVDEAKRGLMGTATQERFIRAQHELLGKYEGYSPKLRRWIQGPMPFLPWALSAARFVYWTMPVHRTATTALLIKTQQVVAKQWAAEHDQVPPGSLKLAIPTKGGGFVDLARYTPYGFTGPVSEGDLGGVTNEVAPQVQGLFGALGGKDPFGRDLTVPRTAANPQGKVTTFGGKALIGANQLAESLIPYVATARRLRERGGTAYSNSTVLSPKVKPNTSHGMSAARRTFDPFRPTYLRKGGGGRVVSSSGSGTLTPQEKVLHEAAARADNGGLTDEQLQILIQAAR